MCLFVLKPEVVATVSAISNSTLSFFFFFFFCLIESAPSCLEFHYLTALPYVAGHLISSLSMDIFYYSVGKYTGLPWWFSGKESACHTGDRGVDP